MLPVSTKKIDNGNSIHYIASVEQHRETETMNIRAFPDTTGYAPKNEAWHAIDSDTYDGAEDAGHQHVGYGHTAEEAIVDLLEQLWDAQEITEWQRYNLFKQHGINQSLWRLGAR